MSTMTVARLHKELGKLVERGLGRRRVCVNKPTFTSNLEGDGLTYHDVRHVGIYVGEFLDDDGGIATRADGTTRTMSAIVLSGSAYDSKEGL